MNGVLVSATRSVFVLFALAPGALAQNRPGNMQSLAAAWNAMHPTVWVSCGYAVIYSGSGGYAPAAAGGAYGGAAAKGF